MMKKNTLFRKGLACTIFILFIGLAFIPSFNAISMSDDTTPPEIELVYELQATLVIFTAICSDESGIDRVEFTLNDLLIDTVFFEPYEWSVSDKINGIVCATAYDTAGNSASDCINWFQPTMPIISGPSSGKIGIEYTFSFNSRDYVLRHCICYVNWSDGSPIETVHPTLYNPNETGPGIANHSWDTKGTYVIRAKGIGEHGEESDWGTLTITMPKNKVSTKPLFLQLSERFINHVSILKQLLNLK